MARTWYDWIGLVLIVAVGAWLIYKLKARFQDRDDRDACDHRLLTGIGDLHEQGDLTEEEYRLIKGHLAQRLERSTRREDRSE